jgi:hypothetical protein
MLSDDLKPQIRSPGTPLKCGRAKPPEIILKNDLDVTEHPHFIPPACDFPLRP